MLEHAGVEAVLDAQADDVKQPLVAHARRAHRRARSTSPWRRFSRSVNEAISARRCAVAPIVIERRPRIDVAILRARALFARRLPRDDRVARNERLERAARRVVEGVVDAREAVGVLRLAEVVLAEIREVAEVAAASGHQRVAATAGELRGGERAGVEQVEPELEVARVRGPHGRGIDDRAHAIAVLDRKAAGVELDAVDQPRIEQADRAQEILQVKRLVQPQPVEHDRGLVRLAAAHGADAGKAVGRRAGQALHGAQRLVGETRHVLHLLLREERVRREIAGREPIAAGLHDDFFELRFLRGSPSSARAGFARRRACDDGKNAGRDLRQREAVRCEDFARQLHALACARLSLDAQIARHDLRVVDEGQPRRAQLVEHFADPSPAQLLRRGRSGQQGARSGASRRAAAAASCSVRRFPQAARGRRMRRSTA